MPVKIYAWTNVAWSSDNVQSTVLSEVNNTGDTIAHTAGLAYDEIAAKPEGFRGLYLYRLGRQRTGTTDISSGITASSFIVNGYNDAEWRAVMVDYWIAWKAKGPIRPNLIVTELEDFTFEPPGRGSDADAMALSLVLADPDIQRHLPRSIWNLSASNIRNDTATTYGLLWSNWMFQISRSVERLVRDTYTQVFGEPVPTMLNYNSMRTTRPYYLDYNQVLPAANHAVNGMSSGQMYLKQIDTSLPKWTGLTKRDRWNVFIDELNRNRAVIGPNIPWVAHPKYDGYQQALSTSRQGWVESLKHLAQLGCDTFMLFFGDPGLQVDPLFSEELNYAQDIAETVVVNTDTVTPLPAVAFDADSVTTGNYTTVYSAADWE